MLLGVAVAAMLSTQAPAGAAPARDRRPPRTTVALSGTRGSHGWYVGPVTLRFTSVDDRPGVEIQVDGHTIGSPTRSKGTTQRVSTVVGMYSGVHVVSFRGRDAAGNVEATQIVRVAHDHHPPNPYVTGLWGWRNSDVHVTPHCEDPGSGCASAAMSIAGGAMKPFRPFVVSAEGRTTLRLVATDVAGNTGSEVFGIHIDRGSPTARTANRAGDVVIGRPFVSIRGTVGDVLLADGTPGSGVSGAWFNLRPVGDELPGSPPRRSIHLPAARISPDGTVDGSGDVPTGTYELTLGAYDHARNVTQTSPIVIDIQRCPYVEAGRAMPIPGSRPYTSSELTQDARDAAACLAYGESPVRTN